MKNKTLLLVASALMTPAAFAESNFSADITLASDKLLRGFSLSNEESSLIGGAHYSNHLFYTGAVGFSNIQIHDGTEEELIDALIGKKFGFELATLDVGYVHHFFTKTSEADSGEWYVGAIVNNYSFHYYYNDTLSENYYDFNSHFDVFDDFRLSFHAGRLESTVNDAVDFNDVSLGLSKQINDFNLALTYAHNSNDQALRQVAGDHVVLSVSLKL